MYRLHDYNILCYVMFYCTKIIFQKICCSYCYCCYYYIGRMRTKIKFAAVHIAAYLKVKIFWNVKP